MKVEYLLKKLLRKKSIVLRGNNILVKTDWIDLNELQDRFDKLNSKKEVKKNGRK